MAETVFVLGAGFSCSLVDPLFSDRPMVLPPPVTNNFFQMLVGPFRLGEKLESIRLKRVPIDVLLSAREKYWHLTLDDFASHHFDLEECMTFFESRMNDPALPDNERLESAQAGYTLRQLLISYLSQMFLSSTPMAKAFGRHVLGARADILTFNYDTVAEEAITHASGRGPNPWPQEFIGYGAPPIPDASLGSSDTTWKPALAYGFRFDEVDLPFPISQPIDGARYYAHPDNQLYRSTRVLKLHGSANWLRYTQNRSIPVEFTPELREQFPQGVVLDHSTKSWMLEPLQRAY